MSRGNDWEKQIKDAEAHAAKIEQMRQNLQNSGDERNLRVEKEVPVFGDETQYKLTDNTGARTEIHIKDSGNVEARGEQTELADHVAKGEKVRPLSARPETQSNIRQQAYQAIDASVLTEAEKTELKQRVENYNFAGAKEKPDEVVESLKTAVGRQENKEQEDAEKIQQYRGVSNKKKQDVPENSARTANKGMMTALTAEALKDIADKGR